jgi:portal protein/F like protein
VSDSYSITIKPPRTAGAANVIDLHPTFMTRLRAGVQAFTGKVPNWFGPEAPLPPQAPAEIAGRQFDFPTGYNLNYTPKFLEGVGFKTLQTVSYSWDLLRLIIETRKDQVCQLDWSIMPKDSTKKANARCQAIQDWFAMPDKTHTWEEWLRMLLEDLLVIDAPCIYPRFTNGGTLYALEPVDGSTIKRVIDDFGRTPSIEYTAYQQILKGIPATNMNRDELIYRPRNMRNSMVYGYSPVEQLMVLIQIALNREASMLQYYTNGSMPDLILSVPATWGPDQIKTFKMWWDSILAGNTAAKRGTMFVFDGTKAINTKEQLLTSKDDEWFARLACFCFSMSPQPFIQESTRASAVTAATQAKEEGIGPVIQWVKNTMDFILTKYWNEPTLCFQWSRDQETDPLTRAQVNNLKVRAGAKTINEWRQDDGEDPIEGGDAAMVFTATGAVLLTDAAMSAEEKAQLTQAQTAENMLTGNEPTEGSPQAGTAKGPVNAIPGRGAGPAASGAAGSNKPPSQTRTANDKSGPRGSNKSVNKAREDLEKRLQSTHNHHVVQAIPLIKAKKNIGRPVTKDETQLAKDITIGLRKMSATILASLVAQGFGRPHPGTSLQDVDTVLANIVTGTNALAAPVTKALTKQISDGYDAAVIQIKAEKALGAGVAGSDAAAYAASRSASLVSEIDETTKAMIRDTVAKALDEGWSVKQLAEALSKDYAFSASRAATIAATEMNDALTHAELNAWETTGIVKAVEWQVSSLEGVCAVCEGNADEGPVPLGTDFSSGDDGPPAHPNCRCALIPVLS